MIPIKLNLQRFASTTIYLSVYTGSYNVTFQGRLDVSSIADSSNNQSTVTVSLYVRKQNSSSATTGKSWSGDITIDGTSDAFSSMSSSTSVGNDWVLMRTYSKVVSHNTDGSKTIYISGSIKGASGTSLANATSSGGDYFALDTIPRYFSSTPLISLASKTETEMVYNWATSEACSSITLYGGGNATFTGIGGARGTITITGLNAGDTYSHYGTFTRSDSGLPSSSNTATNSTYAYPTITSTPNFVIGQELTIRFSNPRQLSCTIYVIAADNTQDSGTTTTGEIVYGYLNETYQNFFYNSIPNSASGQYKVRLVVPALGRDTTINGGTYTINYDVSKPTFSNFEFEDVNSTTLALTGDSSQLIDGYSKVGVTISGSNVATAYKNASISKYNINGTNYDFAQSFYQEIANYSLGYINVSAVDTRGNEKLVQKSTNLIGYFKPTKNYFEYERSNQGVGSQVTFKFNGTFWNNNFGQVANSITSAKYKFKKTGASTYEPEINIDTSLISVSGNNYSFSGVLNGDGEDDGFDIESSYNVVITISDELDSVEFNYVVIEGSPAIDLVGNSISLGGMYNETLGGRIQLNGLTNFNCNWLSDIDLNNVNKTGFYYCLTNLTNSPTSGYLYLIVLRISYSGDFLQLALDISTNVMYHRTFINGTTWTTWKRVTTS